MSNRPLLNLFDVAGIAMICVIVCTILAGLGSKLVTWDAVLVLIVVFAGTAFFAKRGVP